MKKTFTLVAIAAFITTATFAQNGHSRDNNYDKGRAVAINNDRDGYGHGRERSTYYFSAREREMQLFSINREYSNKTESVKHRLFMGRNKKEQLIYSLELQRKAEIRGVMAKFNDRRNLFNKDYGRYGPEKRSNW